MPLPFIAIPVLHSSGLWIASVSGSYIASTISSTWVGAFVLGNSGLLSALGLASSAGIIGMAAGSTAAVGSALTAVGLGGAATALGIAPIATFLGMTLAGWVIVGVAAIVGLGLGLVTLFPGILQWVGWALAEIGLGGVAEWLGIAPVPTFLGLTATQWAVTGGILLLISVPLHLVRRTMRRINRERRKGALPPITALGIVRELRVHKNAAARSFLERLATGQGDVALSDDGKTLRVDGQALSVSRLNHVVHDDGSEELRYRRRAGGERRVLFVKAATADGGSNLVGA